MNDKRHLTRWRLIYYLRIFDVRDGSLLGHVVDISTEGLMLISAEALPAGRAFTLRIEIPGEDGIRRQVELQAESCWLNPDINSDFFYTGFRLIDPSESAVAEICAIIDDLHFSGPPSLGPGENSTTSKFVTHNRRQRDEDAA